MNLLDCTRFGSISLLVGALNHVTDGMTVWEDAIVALSSSRNARVDGRREGRQEQKKNAVSENLGGLCLPVSLLGREQRQQRKVSEVIFTGYQKRHSTKWSHTEDVLGESQSAPLSFGDMEPKSTDLAVKGEVQVCPG